VVELQSVTNEIEAFGRSHVCPDLLHGWEHMERVLFYAEKVNQELQGNWLIIRAACQLHDIGHVTGKGDHPQTGAVLADGFLTGLGIEESVVKQITACILTHSRQYTKERPVSAEAKVLYDADGMDLFGAVGLMRSILAGADSFPAVHKKLEWRLSQVENFYSQYALRFVKEQSVIIRSFSQSFKEQLLWFHCD